MSDETRSPYGDDVRDPYEGDDVKNPHDGEPGEEPVPAPTEEQTPGTPKGTSRPRKTTRATKKT